MGSDMPQANPESLQGKCALITGAARRIGAAIAELLHHHGLDRGVRIARKHLAWYSKGLPESAEFRGKIMSINDADGVREEVRRYYYPQLDRQAA